MERYHQIQRMSTRNSNLHDLLNLDHPTKAKHFSNRNLGIPMPQEDPKIEQSKRRNHRLDHLSSYYYPIIPRQYIKRTQNEKKYISSKS